MPSNVIKNLTYVENFVKVLQLTKMGSGLWCGLSNMDMSKFGSFQHYTVICIENCRCSVWKFVVLDKHCLIYIYIYICDLLHLLSLPYLDWELREHIVSWRFDDEKPAHEIAPLETAWKLQFITLCPWPTLYIWHNHQSISSAMKQSTNFGSRRYELYIFSSRDKTQVCT